MYSRLLDSQVQQSFFLFGPRGTGKSWWVRHTFPGAIVIDLLEHGTSLSLMSNPDRIETLLPPQYAGWVIIDEVQKVPALLDTVHRIIESRGIKFILTGSSARKLRRSGSNLLAGRALTRTMHPLTVQEIGSDFDLDRALRYGLLPLSLAASNPADYLASYVETYLAEEVRQEALVRNVPAFARFLEALSFSQGSPLNLSEVARECSVERKTVQGYVELLEDLLLAERIPVFTKRAARKTPSHPKFYFFDTGVYRALRPAGPLDRPEEIDGIAFESLVYQHLRALVNYARSDFELAYWRTLDGREVDFVLYGKNGLFALEVKRARNLRSDDTRGIRAFLADYPEAKVRILYGGTERRFETGYEVVPFLDGLRELPEWLGLH